MGAPALALKAGLVDQGMADHMQGVTEMMGQNKHFWGSAQAGPPTAWPVGIGYRVLRWLGALRPSKLLVLVLEGGGRC